MERRTHKLYYIYDMEKSKNQIRKEIFQFLKKNGILTLAVASENAP